MKLTTAFSKFLFQKKISGLKEKTIYDYTTHIKPFMSYVNTINVTDIETLTEDVVNNYILSLYDKTISKATIATYIRNLKIFLRFIEEEYQIDTNASKIKIPKCNPKNPHIYTDDEIYHIFNTVLTGNNWIDYRNAAIIALMLDSGLRQNETSTIERSKIDFDKRVICVTGKGDKERFVPLGHVSEKLLRIYMSECPYFPSSTEPYVFFDRYGYGISNNAIKLFMNNYSKKLPFEFSSHRLRHNFGTNFLLDQYEKYGSMDIYALMTIMGHADIATTRGYLHVANQIIYSQNHLSHLDKLDEII